REVKTNGVIVTIAGTGSVGYNGDGEPATSANINYPNGVALDSAGNVYIGDSNNERIREVVKSTGAIATVAGNGSAGFGGDGGPATSASLYYPNGLTVDGNGNLFIADAYNYRVREVLSSNTPFLAAPSSTAWTINQPGLNSPLSILGGTAPYGGLSAAGLPPGLFASLNGSTITLGGTPTSAGTYSVSVGVVDALGNPASRTFGFTVNALPGLGALTPAQGTAGVSYPGTIPVTGGTGPFTFTASPGLPPGLSVTFNGTGVAFAGIPTTTGAYNNIQLTVRDATGAQASGVFSLTISAPAPGSILTVAGTGSYGSSGDGGPANLATMYLPRATAEDAAGNVYIADTYNNKIREIVKATGNIITIAGTGLSGFSGDGGPATAAKLYYPTGVAVGAGGNNFLN